MLVRSLKNQQRHYNSRNPAFSSWHSNTRHPRHHSRLRPRSFVFSLWLSSSWFFSIPWRQDDGMILITFQFPVTYRETMTRGIPTSLFFHLLPWVFPPIWYDVLFFITGLWYKLTGRRYFIGPLNCDRQSIPTPNRSAILVESVPTPYTILCIFLLKN